MAQTRHEGAAVTRKQTLHSRKAPLLTRFWFVLTLGLGLAGFTLFVRNASTVVPASWGVEGGAREGFDQWFNSLQQNLISPALISFLGALILTQRPEHRIGRLMLVLGGVTAIATLAQEWAVYGYYTLNADLPGVEIAAWLTNWIWVVLFGLLLLTAAVFPDGEFLSPGWRWFVGVPWLCFVVSMILGAMVETPMSSVFQLPNPFVQTHPKVFYDVMFTTGLIAIPVSAIAILISAIVRFRVSHARERHQMKWLMFGVAIMTFLTVAGLGLTFGLGTNIGAIMVNTATVGPALGVGIALLRHRLYDIDIIIRRTLQYGLLTGILALIYFGGVVILQSILRPLTDSGDSPLVTVLTTLGIAALFNPFRRQVQNFIDRRFYRKKYNAEQALENFARVARDEVDMDRLTAALLRVAEETVQPEKVSLWVKDLDTNPIVRKARSELKRAS